MNIMYYIYLHNSHLEVNTLDMNYLKALDKLTFTISDIEKLIDSTEIDRYLLFS